MEKVKKIVLIGASGFVGSALLNEALNRATSEFDIGIRLQDFALAGTLPYFRQALDVAAVEIGRESCRERV